MGLLETLVRTAAKNSVTKTVGAVVEGTILAAAEGYAKVNEQRTELGFPLPTQKSMLIKVPCCSDDFIGERMEDVIEKLTAYGFTNIATLPQKDLFRFQHKSVGKVAKIAANGKEDFKSKAKFPSDARFVITYHELRK